GRQDQNTEFFQHDLEAGLAPFLRLQLDRKRAAEQEAERVARERANAEEFEYQEGQLEELIKQMVTTLSSCLALRQEGGKWSMDIMKSRENNNDTSNNDDINVSQPVTALAWFQRRLALGEEIGMVEFSKEFGYIHEEDAHAAFMYPLSSTEIPRSTRTKFTREYETWRRNEGAEYWTSPSSPTKSSKPSGSTEERQ
ncbi:hypothetical protein BGZ80_007251, partial [Entomortierella chlamydospora]